MLAKSALARLLLSFFHMSHGDIVVKTHCQWYLASTIKALSFIFSSPHGGFSDSTLATKFECGDNIDKHIGDKKGVLNCAERQSDEANSDGIFGPYLRYLVNPELCDSKVSTVVVLTAH